VRRRQRLRAKPEPAEPAASPGHFWPGPRRPRCPCPVGPCASLAGASGSMSGSLWKRRFESNTCSPVPLGNPIPAAPAPAASGTVLATTTHRDHDVRYRAMGSNAEGRGQGGGLLFFFYKKGLGVRPRPLPAQLVCSDSTNNPKPPPHPTTPLPMPRSPFVLLPLLLVGPRDVNTQCCCSQPCNPPLKSKRLMHTSYWPYMSKLRIASSSPPSRMV
jgi:hypothetical protein